jgi:hypothetical protein
MQKKKGLKKLNDMQALANCKTYDPITYDEFLSTLGDTTLTKIKQMYGETVAEDTRGYFMRHPSKRFVWIQNGCREIDAPSGCE